MEVVYQMSRLRLLLLGLFAVIAVSAVAASSASALLWYECKNMGTGGSFKNSLCSETQSNGAWEWVLIPLNTLLPVVSKQTESFVLKSKVPATQSPVKIECTSESGTGWVENLSATGNGSDGGTITFTGCSVTEPAEGCTVATIVAKVKTKLVTISSKVEDEFEPESGSNFTEIEITGCTIAGKYAITGTVNGIVNANGVLEFLPSNGTLKFADEPATLKGKSEQMIETSNAGITAK